MGEREWQIHVSHRQIAIQQLLASAVWLRALDFIFTLCVSPCHELVPVTSLFGCFGLGWCFALWIFWFVWFVCGFWSFVDVVTDWTMYRSFTRSLLKPLNLQAAMYALISQLTLVCNMQLNVLDDLAEAMKALEGKKLCVSPCPGILILVVQTRSFFRLIAHARSIFHVYVCINIRGEAS